MAEKDLDMNGSHFDISFRECDWLDITHVVFGRLIDKSMEVLKRIEKEDASDGGERIKNVVIKNVVIAECIKIRKRS